MKELDIVCGAICLNDNYFIAKRGKGVDEGFWEFPGGKVEENETFEQAIIRELKEELEIDVEVIKHICSVDDKRDTIVLHVHAYLCKIINGTIQLHVHNESAWVKPKQLYQYQFQEADQFILDKINESK